MKLLQLLIFLLIITSCQEESDKLTEKEFMVLMENIEDAWSTQDTEKALSSFTQDAIYMEPPDVQYFRGHEQLRAYFDELTETHEMKFHHMWFNKESQVGGGEFTFSYGRDTSTVGIVIVEIDKGKIKFWREYLQTGPSDFKKFLSTENKDWKWHIGNYPVPKDTILPN